MKRGSPLLTSKGDWSQLSVFLGKKTGRSVGVAIPRALMPHSTSRNRLRRQIREAIRILAPLGSKRGLAPEKKKYYYLVRVKKQEKTLTFKKIQEEMQAHFRRMEF
ncbi:MAG: ribonuclease P protein component [Candidatus Omnitrophota bacterium]